MKSHRKIDTDAQIDPEDISIESTWEAPVDFYYTVTSDFKELQHTHAEHLNKLRGIIIQLAYEYNGKYPIWQYADALAKALAKLDWEAELGAQDHPF